MKFNLILIISFLISLGSCNGQGTAIKQAETVHLGDTVNALGSSVMVVFQDKNNNYWFGSWETGVYKYNGNTLINYTTKHGLHDNRVDEIKEDEAGNLYFTSANIHSVIAKYDGTHFSKLTAVAR